MARFFPSGVSCRLRAPIISLALLVSPATAGQSTTLIVQQDVPALLEHHLEGEGTSHVDIVGFEADISDGDGRAGVLSGILLTLDIPKATGENFVDRIGNLVFDFGENDTIIASGKSIYGREQTEMSIDRPQIRAVVGGTGIYIGARGQVTTSRNADGTYKHVIELLR